MLFAAAAIVAWLMAVFVPPALAGSTGSGAVVPIPGQFYPWSYGMWLVNESSSDAAVESITFDLRTATAPFGMTWAVVGVSEPTRASVTGIGSEKMVLTFAPFAPLLAGERFGLFPTYPQSITGSPSPMPAEAMDGTSVTFHCTDSTAWHGVLRDVDPQPGFPYPDAFLVLGPVPEPATYALMIAGLSAVAFAVAARRRA